MKVLLNLMFGVLFSSAFGNDYKRYDNYKVFKMVPITNEQVNLLEHLEKSQIYNFWTDIVKINEEVRVMVQPQEEELFLNGITKAGLEYITVIDNVQRLIDEQKVAPYPRTARNDNFDWINYHVFDDIMSWLDSLAVRYPNNVEIIIAGQSVEGRQIKGVKLTFGDRRERFMIEGGIHAREWISPATVTYLINEFLTSTDPDVRRTADRFEWHIFPVTNPDGYHYSHVGDRMWRKNRGIYNSTCNAGVSSLGVDLNRNFGYQWMAIGASSSSCDQTFAGPEPFSEPEAQAIVSYTSAISQNLMYYISFHSYSQMILVPYSHTTEYLDNYADAYEIGARGIDSLTRRYNTSYTIGTSAEILYPVGGASFDWVKAAVRVPLVYLFELRDRGQTGFLLPEDQIIPNSLEIMDSLITMVDVGARLGYYDHSSGANLGAFGLLVFVSWMISRLM